MLFLIHVVASVVLSPLLMLKCLPHSIDGNELTDGSDPTLAFRDEGRGGRAELGASVELSMTLENSCKFLRNAAAEEDVGFIIAT